MRTYYRTTKVHSVALQLTTDEAARLLEELDDVETYGLMPTFSKARQMMNRAFDQLEADA
ncbi:hypothetical protein [Streptomyces sp. NBC_00239]|uniref:hypothetical protein n=1 Tax=Streptomyces sp. NBC_00239 TaxID=2903640 RepID=UPI002E281159|nr:hypothetical protein [Streptomyces sp. NBC_00239]